MALAVPRARLAARHTTPWIATLSHEDLAHVPDDNRSPRA